MLTGFPRANGQNLKAIRTREAELLRRELRSAPPSLTVLVGPEGSGKAGAVTLALRGLDAVRYWAAPLAEADQRALFVERLGRWRDAPHAGAAAGGGVAPDARQPLPGDADWPRIFDHILARLAERAAPLLLVLEEFPHLVEARTKLLGEIQRFWGSVRSRGYPLHLVLAGPPHPALDRITSVDGGWGGGGVRMISLDPLSYREVGALFPAYTPRLRLTAWTVFGGLPRHVRACDPDVTLATNIRQSFLTPGAPLLREGYELLLRRFQTVARYASLLRSLARGRRDWSSILADAPEFATGGQMAPYLARLQDVGLVHGETSLDARPQSRSRRYRIADPFVWFWYRFVLPNLTDIEDGRGPEVWRRAVRPQLDAHAAAVFPIACREYLSRYAEGRLPATTRELGGLWGVDHDIDPAGTLRTGSAVYGKTFWGRGRIPESADEALQAELRRTRYGFGKEVRLRLLFSTDGFSPGLVRRVARSDAIYLIGPDELFGG
jgi:hypothetical protein